MTYIQKKVRSDLLKSNLFQAKEVHSSLASKYRWIHHDIE